MSARRASIAACAAALGLALGGAGAAGAQAPALNLVPEPASVRPMASAPVVIADGTPIFIPAGDASALRIARQLAELTRKTRGLRLAPTVGAPAPGQTAIVLVRAGAPGQGREAYGLDIGQGRATLSAGQDAGLFYAAMTLWQLMTPNPGQGDAGHGPVSLPPVHIADTPRFAWRGLMLDSARHYQSPQFILQLIDWMAQHKLNTLHWHLTDDQAWRLEIKRYPRLTKVGGWRTPAGLAAQADIDPKTGKPRLEGGIYTQAQVRRIVAYAAERQITVVPEIEMPGHALSAILAYPQLGSDGAAPRAIQSDWGVFPYLYNTDDQTFGFLKDVLTEVMDLFPSPYIHVGGDEAVKDQWKASPRIQAQMKALGITSEDGLQSWFTHRTAAFLAAHGRRLLGWDEILQGGELPPGATVTSWHGIDGGIAAAKAGHDAVLAPQPTLYFDNRQSDRADEPPGRGTVITLAGIYGFDPAPPSLDPAVRSHILGLQGNLWTEHVRTEAQVQAMLFPRAAAVAEAGWTPQAERAWPSFVARLPAELARERATGLAPDGAALAVRIQAQPDAAPDRAEVTLSQQLGLGTLRYALGGAEPTAASPAYDAPITVALPTTIKAAVFIDGAAAGPSSERRLDAVSVAQLPSQDLKMCTENVVLNLEARTPRAGPRDRFLVDVMNPCWTYSGAQLSGESRLSASVAPLPFNFQLGDARNQIPLRTPHTPNGELEVRADGCSGPPLAAAPLPDPRRHYGLTTLSLALPATLSGRHDLCLSFTAKHLDPMWVLNWVRLDPAARPAGG